MREIVTGLVIVGGVAATMIAWRAIVRGREVWRTLPPTIAVLGVVALVLGAGLDQPTPGGDDVPGVAGLVLVGAGSGVLLFLATRVFVAFAVKVPSFARQTTMAYRRVGSADRGRELLLLLCLAVPGEELFWRGLTYRYGAGVLASTALAAVLAWALYVVANLPSRSLPIVAGAVVGGALWGALAWWSGGVWAPLGSHILWTGLMLAFPPRVLEDG